MSYIKIKNRKCKNCNAECSRLEKIYCNNKCQAEYQTRIKLENGTLSAPSIKRFLIKKERICYICGITTWRDRPVPLVLDHIDGNSSNNSLENLRLVCGNCDMQLPTYKSKNRGNGRYYRRVRYAKGQSY